MPRQGDRCTGSGTSGWKPSLENCENTGSASSCRTSPCRSLWLLVEHAGELVTREQIQNKLWPPGTYVDYDNAINSAMRKLREALGDDSGDPRFIETFARRGYRFIGTLKDALPAQTGPATSAPRKSKRGLITGTCIAFLVLAVVAGGWWLMRARPEVSVAPLTPVPLTAAQGWEFDPSLSPDGNQVAYAWRQAASAVSHIYMKLIGGGSPLQLTTDLHEDVSPAWSPDGRTIAFVRVLGPVNRIYVVPALGGAERQVAEGGFSFVRWSPDGRFLTFTEQHTQPDSWSLSLVGVDTGEKLVVARAPDAKTEFWFSSFSPDGRLLAFTQCSGFTRCGLYLVDLAAGYRPSGTPRLLLEQNGGIFGTAWTANGREFVYVSSDYQGSGNPVGNVNLMRVRAKAGSQPQRLTFAGEEAYSPDVAQRGNRLAYVHRSGVDSIWQVQQGKPARSFISSTRSEWAPQYSTDGKQVAFSSDRSGLDQIWACDQDGGNPVQLTHFDTGNSGSARWSPDGRWMAFDHQEKDGWRIYVMAPDGGQIHRLAEDVGDSVIPSWSGDGKWIYYANSRTGRFEIWKRKARGGQGMQLTHNGGLVAFESGDGRSLYYQKDEYEGVWVLPAGGGEAKQVLDAVWYRTFVVVDDGIYYIPFPTAKGGSVRFHSFATGKDNEIASFIQQPGQGLSVSPDRKTILFPLEVQNGSNIMVVDNFR